MPRGLLGGSWRWQIWTQPPHTLANATVSDARKTREKSLPTCAHKNTCRMTAINSEEGVVVIIVIGHEGWCGVFQVCMASCVESKPKLEFNL